MNEEIEIVPCKFCGNHAYLEEVTSGFLGNIEGYMMVCDDDSDEPCTRFRPIYPEREVTIDRWNAANYTT